MIKHYAWDEVIPKEDVYNLLQLKPDNREEYLSLLNLTYNLKMVLSFPIQVYLELTNHCNLNCAMCNYDQMTRSKGYLDPDLAKKVVDEGVASGRLYYLALFIHGEPLLYPYLIEIIQYAKDRKVPVVNVTTNGVLLTEELSRKMIEAGLDSLVISFMGVTKEGYVRLQGSEGSYQRVMDNIQQICRLKKEVKSKVPFISLKTLIEETDDTEQIAAFRSKWAKIVDFVNIILVNPRGHGNKIIQVSGKPDPERVPCRQIWQKAIVLHDGTLSGCCYDIDGLVSGGTIQEAGGLGAAWNGKRLNRIREMHLRGEYHKIPYCRDCHSNY